MTEIFTVTVKAMFRMIFSRFRRLHGTVGMPGEPKPQLPQRTDSYTNINQPEEMSDSNSNQHEEPYLAPWEMVDVSNWDSSRCSSIKQEPIDSCSDDDEIEEKKPVVNNISESNRITEPLTVPSDFPRPKIMDDKHLLKSELSEEFNESKENGLNDIVLNVDANKNGNNNRTDQQPGTSGSNIKPETDEKKMSTYKQLVLLNSYVRETPPIEIKTEMSDSSPNFKTDLEETAIDIKTEPILEGKIIFLTYNCDGKLNCKFHKHVLIVLGKYALLRYFSNFVPLP